jgi:lipid-A-disaccharide synthase
MYKNKLMIIAGEVSGDLHGAALIRELRKLDSGMEFYGIGGNLMQKEGATLVQHLNRMAFLGFVEVIKHIPFIKKVQATLIKLIKEKKINTVVLIDYPGFNLNFAKKLNAINLKIIYYISPQIWAWGKNRVSKIKQLINKMIVVFPFEKEIYEKAGVDVDYIGHPLLEIIDNHNYLSKDELYRKYELDFEKDILLIMPGSRRHEVEKIFPETIIASEKICDDFNMQIVVSTSQNINGELLFNIANKRNFKVISGLTYDLMRNSKFGIIKSGTSTLEAAIFQLPMVIVYKTSVPTYYIGRSLIKIDKIGMANIILGEQVVPELIQRNVSHRNIYDKSREILSNPALYDSIKKKLGLIKEKLDGDCASAKAAKIIFDMMNEIKKN